MAKCSVGLSATTLTGAAVAVSATAALRDEAGEVRPLREYHAAGTQPTV